MTRDTQQSFEKSRTAMNLVRGAVFATTLTGR
jgi:hypothetical protein